VTENADVSEQRTVRVVRAWRGGGCRLCPERVHPEKPCILGGPDFWGLCHFHTHPETGERTYPPPGLWNGHKWVPSGWR
jgi:hypothetical protein